MAWKKNRDSVGPPQIRININKINNDDNVHLFYIPFTTKLICLLIFFFYFRLIWKKTRFDRLYLFTREVFSGVQEILQQMNKAWWYTLYTHIIRLSIWNAFFFSIFFSPEFSFFFHRMYLRTIKLFQYFRTRVLYTGPRLIDHEPTFTPRCRFFNSIRIFPLFRATKWNKSRAFASYY